MKKFNFSFIKVSTNAKTGPIPVTRTDKTSCPTSCPLLGNGCYAAIGRPNIHWKKLNNSGLTLSELLQNIKKLPVGQLWRHNEAGDLPHIGDNKTICADTLAQIVAANKKKKGFTYSHFPLIAENVETLLAANNDGFTVNVSANSLAEVDQAMAQNLPAVVVVADNAPNKFTTPAGNNVIVCPNQLKDSIQCAACGLCAKRDRNFAIAFKAHGIGKNKVKKALQL